MKTRNIYEILRDKDGNSVLDPDGNAITVLVGTEEIIEEEAPQHDEVILEPEPTKAELLEQIKLLMDKVNSIKE
jgi:hypothetical protein